MKKACTASIVWIAYIAVILCLAAITLWGMRAFGAERAQHRVKVTQVNEYQAIVTCRNGRTPEVVTMDGALLVSCGRREQ